MCDGGSGSSCFLRSAIAARQVVVIGAGVGGLAAARAAAGAGARVTLVGNEPPGGRAVWRSLLPSKVLLTVADALGRSRRFPELGLRDVTGAPDLAATMRRIIAPRFASTLERLRASVVVVGAGPTGAEFVHGFNRLGAAVTWAGLHAAGALAPEYHPHTLVEAVYTDPEVAQIGSRDAGAASQDRDVRVLKLPNRMNLKAALAGETGGFVKLVAGAAREA